MNGVGLVLTEPLPEVTFSIFSPPPTHAMPDTWSPKKELKGWGVLSTFSKRGSVPTFEEGEKRRIWRTLDIHLLPLVTLLYLMSFL